MATTFFVVDKCTNKFQPSADFKNAKSCGIKMLSLFFFTLYLIRQRVLFARSAFLCHCRPISIKLMCPTIDFLSRVFSLLFTVEKQKRVNIELFPPFFQELSYLKFYYQSHSLLLFCLLSPSRKTEISLCERVVIVSFGGNGKEKWEIIALKGMRIMVDSSYHENNSNLRFFFEFYCRVLLSSSLFFVFD